MKEWNTRNSNWEINWYFVSKNSCYDRDVFSNFRSWFKNSNRRSMFGTKIEKKRKYFQFSNCKKYISQYKYFHFHTDLYTFNFSKNAHELILKR